LSKESDYYLAFVKRGVELATYAHNGIKLVATTELREWIDCNREFDILIAYQTPVRNEKRLLSIEIKIDSNAATLFHQALVRCQIADYCYIGFPLQRLPYFWYKFTQYKLHYKEKNKPFTVGLLIFDLKTKAIYTMHYAKKNKSLLNQEWKGKVYNSIISKIKGKLI